MHSFLNNERPPVFCPGCSHEQVVNYLDKTLLNLDLQGNEVSLVSDIGCSGLFDTFFNTHAMHGLHGRALTYASGIKLARPELNVIVTMGDGGIGIGGAHFIASCRRNLDLTLFVLNNFNFGMTGGQYSVTTPEDAGLVTGFLNQLEKPLDVCELAVTAGATHVTRCSCYDNDLADKMKAAIQHKGFSVVEFLGICPGRYSKQNKITKDSIAKSIDRLPRRNGPVTENIREEYGQKYRELSNSKGNISTKSNIEPKFTPPENKRFEVLILGKAGQRIITAGELFCISAFFGGFKGVQKNEFNITVLRGPSITEVVLSPDKINYTGIKQPSLVIAISQEGIDRRLPMLKQLEKDAIILSAKGVKLPETKARVETIDFKQLKVGTKDMAMYSLVHLAKENRIITMEMLKASVGHRFKGKTQKDILAFIDRI